MSTSDKYNVKPVTTGYFVAEGHGVQCKRGKLKPGDLVLPKWVAGGDAGMKVLLDAGGIEYRENGKVVPQKSRKKMDKKDAE